MYNIKLYDYVPRPEPAKSDKIIAAHYYPSWTRGENGLINEFHDLKPFPERTPLMGYYEDKNPEIIDWEIKWSLEHGINCFIYCWYRKKVNQGKPMTVSDLRLAKGLHEGFFKARYSSMMNFAIMFETQPKWGCADRDDLINNVLPFWMENYFSRENYLKIDNKPVVFIYDTAYCLRDSLGGDEGMKKALDECRKIAKNHGYDGINFIAQIWPPDVERIEQAKARGIDAVFVYNWTPTGVDPSQEAVYKRQMEMNLYYMGKDSSSYIPTVSQFFDPEPRYTTLPQIDYGPNFWYTHFDTYRKLLRSVKSMSDASPENEFSHKMIMVDNMNEWDEGHFLLPSYRFGFKYLQAIREELTERNNLPDYRMPEQLGFGRYDEAWDIEDLSRYNYRKLDDGEFTMYR